MSQQQPGVQVLLEVVFRGSVDQSSYWLQEFCRLVTWPTLLPPESWVFPDDYGTDAKNADGFHFPQLEIERYWWIEEHPFIHCGLRDSTTEDDQPFSLEDFTAIMSRRGWHTEEAFAAIK